MTGLDKILNQIEEEAKSSAGKIIEEANTQAKAVLDEAENTCRDLEKAAAAKMEAAVEDVLKKSRSSADYQRDDRQGPRFVIYPGGCGVF